MFVSTVRFRGVKTDISRHRVGHGNKEMEFIAVRSDFFSQKESGMRRLFECSNGKKAQRMQGGVSSVEHATSIFTYRIIA